MLATFISQLVMLNMLIAIMGDSFNKEVENKELNRTKTKLEMLGDFSFILNKKDKKEENLTYMFVAMVSGTQDYDPDNWEGSIRRLTNVVECQSRSLKERFE